MAILSIQHLIFEIEVAEIYIDSAVFIRCLFYLEQDDSVQVEILLLLMVRFYVLEYNFLLHGLLLLLEILDALSL